MALTEAVGDVVADAVGAGQALERGVEQGSAGLSVDVEIAPNEDVVAAVEFVDKDTGCVLETVQRLRRGRAVVLGMEECARCCGRGEPALRQKLCDDRVAAGQLDQFLGKRGRRDSAPHAVHCVLLLRVAARARRTLVRAFIPCRTSKGDFVDIGKAEVQQKVLCSEIVGRWLVQFREVGRFYAAVAEAAIVAVAAHIFAGEGRVRHFGKRTHVVAG